MVLTEQRPRRQHARQKGNESRTSALTEGSKLGPLGQPGPEECCNVLLCQVFGQHRDTVLHCSGGTAAAQMRASDKYTCWDVHALIEACMISSAVAILGSE